MILWKMHMNDIGHKGFQHLVLNLYRRKKTYSYYFFILETRQLNRRHYESYVCRRIIGKQAVVVLGCDNRHMDQLMGKKFFERTQDFLIKQNLISFYLVAEPGIVMIFAHGVE